MITDMKKHGIIPINMIASMLLFVTCISCLASDRVVDLTTSGLKNVSEELFLIPRKSKNAADWKYTNLSASLSSGEGMSWQFIVNDLEPGAGESRSCVSGSGYVIDGCHFVIENTKKDLRIYIGYGKHKDLPYYVIHRFSEHEEINVTVVKTKEYLEWAVEGPYRTIGGIVKIEKEKESMQLAIKGTQGKQLEYLITAATINRELQIPDYQKCEVHPLYKYEETSVSKYDWDEPAAKYLTYDAGSKQLTSAEIDGFYKYLLNYQLPTHNHMNYYFRKRMNSYMLEWVYGFKQDIALVNKAIEVAMRAITYRNDNFGKHKISFDRSVGPVWPNYKEVEVYEDGTDGLVPGASVFAGLPAISVAARLIVNNPDLWEKTYNGRKYIDIAYQLIDEGLKTVDYVYDVFVGDDHLITYPSTLLREGWHGRVYIFNRVFPLLSGSIPLAECMETLNVNPEKVTQIDAVNKAMIGYLKSRIEFYDYNGKECMRYPYSEAMAEKNSSKVEDLMHGSFDSRDFQLFYLSNRYDWNDRYVKAMANTIFDVAYKGDQKYTTFLDGLGKAKVVTSPIAFDGFIWYLRYRPDMYTELMPSLKAVTVDKHGVYDAYILYELLKLKVQK